MKIQKNYKIIKMINKKKNKKKIVSISRKKNFQKLKMLKNKFRKIILSENNTFSV